MPIKKKLTESQLKKIWKEEIKRRIDFGISEEVFSFGFTSNVKYCSIKFLRDFETIFHSYNVIKDIKFHPITHKRDFERRILFIDTVNKYKRYTFNQIKNAGGALQLSKVCPFVHIIEQQNIEYKGCKIEIYHRKKDAINSKEYPDKVLDVFKNDSFCRAVAFIYKEPLKRTVFFEKTKNFQKVKDKNIHLEYDYDEFFDDGIYSI